MARLQYITKWRYSNLLQNGDNPIYFKMAIIQFITKWRFSNLLQNGNASTVERLS